MLMDEQVFREVMLHLLYVGGRGGKIALLLSRNRGLRAGNRREQTTDCLLVNCKQASLLLKALMLIMEKACENFGHQHLSLLCSWRFGAGKERSVRSIKG